MATFELDLYDLSWPALGVVRAAIKFARLNSPRQIHVVPLQDFYELAGLASEMPLSEFHGLLMEVRHTSIFSSDYEPAVLWGWLIFEHLSINETHVKFSICSHAFGASEPVEFLPAGFETLATMPNGTLQ